MCDRTTHSCIELHHLQGNTGPIPDCCQENLKTMLKDLATIFNESGLRYWLDWGSLLGLVRDNKLIPYDRDLDFGFFSQDLPKLHKLANKINDKGYFYCPKKCIGYRGNVETSHPRIFFSKVNRTFADIFLWCQCSGHNYGKHYNMALHASSQSRINRCPKVFYDNLSTIEFEGVTIKTPADPKTYLELRYGPGWTIPDPLFYKKGGHGIRLNQVRKFIA